MSSPLRVEDVYMTPEEYLAAERVSETKHEYVAGVVYAMAGGSRIHARITNNIILTLGPQLAGTNCFPFGPDLRVRIDQPGRTFFYDPDVAVDCSNSDEDEITAPSVIFEVLSPSTHRADYGDKQQNYQTIASLNVYGLVDQNRAIVTIYRRQQDGAWAIELYSDLEQTVPLPEIACTLPMAAIYQGVFSVGSDGQIPG
jgi:Uma2 family endonuclease